MKIKKYIEDEKLLIDVDGQTSWIRDLRSGNSNILNQKHYQNYRKNWSQADYSETPELVLVNTFIKMKSRSECGFQGFLSDGSRPNHIFNNDMNKPQPNWIGDVRLKDGLKLRLGDESDALVRFLFNTPIEDFLMIGRFWWLRWGDQLLAECEMKKISTTHNNAYSA